MVSAWAGVAAPSAIRVATDRAFYKLTKVKKVTCKANIDSIGDKAFYGCKNLKIFNASKAAITSVGDRAGVPFREFARRPSDSSLPRPSMVFSLPQL